MKKIYMLVLALFVSTMAFAQFKSIGFDDRGIDPRFTQTQQATPAMRNVTTLSYCGDFGNGGSIGTGTPGISWGIRFDPDQLAGFSFLRQISIYAVGATAHTFTIYQGGTEQPETVLVEYDPITFPAANAWYNVTVPATAFDATKTLWLVVSENQTAYPAASINNGPCADLRGDFVYAGGWGHCSQMGVAYATWMLKATISDNDDAMVTIAGPKAPKVGTLCTYTYTVDDESFELVNWTVDGEMVPSDEALEYTFEDTNTHTIGVSLTNGNKTATASLEVTPFECTDVTVFPWVNNFADKFDCWTLIDADGDGENFEPQAGYDYAISYSWNDVALTPDNYIVSPMISLPADGAYSLYWKDAALSDMWSGDYYQVLVSEDPNFGESEMLYEGIVQTTTFTERTASLAGYAGKDVYVAFRHCDSEDIMGLCISAVRIDAFTLTLTGATSGKIGDLLVYEVNGPQDAEYQWVISGDYEGEPLGASAFISWKEAGEFNVKVTMNGQFESNTLTVNIIECKEIANFPYQEGFETGNESCWTFIDNDGDGYEWITKGDYDKYEVDDELIAEAAYEGVRCALSASYTNAVGVLTPDNWLISPVMVIPADATQLTWQVNTVGSEFYYDYYELLISPTGDEAMSSFTVVGLEDEIDMEEYTMRTVDLTPYQGMKIRFAFRHYNSEDGWWFSIDDINIDGTGHEGINENEVERVSVYPNPVQGSMTLNGVAENSQVNIYDAMGRTVMSFIYNGQNVNVENLASGVYSVQVNNQVVRFVK